MCKSGTEDAINWPGKVKNFTGTGEVKSSLGEGKNSSYWVEIHLIRYRLRGVQKVLHSARASASEVIDSYSLIWC